MQISVIAHPNSKHPRVEKDLLGGLNVYVKEPPLEGKANKAVAEVLAEYFDVAKSRVQLVRGERSKLKFFRIA